VSECLFMRMASPRLLTFTRWCDYMLLTKHPKFLLDFVVIYLLAYLLDTVVDERK